MKDLVIIGSGGFARETVRLVKEINMCKPVWQIIGFVDSDQSKWGKIINGIKVLGDIKIIHEMPGDTFIVCAIANPEYKKVIVHGLDVDSDRYAKIIHPGVNITNGVLVSEGVIIQEGSILTIDISIGKHVSINPGCGIGHDVHIGDFSTLMWHVNVSGNVMIEEGCVLGTNSTILQGKTIGQWSTVGAGAVVIDNLPKNCTAVGIPANPIKND